MTAGRAGAAQSVVKTRARGQPWRAYPLKVHEAVTAKMDPAPGSSYDTKRFQPVKPTKELKWNHKKCVSNPIEGRKMENGRTDAWEK